MGKPLLQIHNLKKYYSINKGFGKKEYVKVVDDVSFNIEKGETVGLVGESGCGKSTTGKAILHLIPLTDGEVTYNGYNLAQLTRNQMQQLRREMQIVFQDPYASLNPRLKVREILLEPLNVHKIGTKAERQKMVEEYLDVVGLGRHYLNRYPHEFSGGQRQRIGIARALILNPSLIVADEPVSALDVSIQAQILNLLQDLQKQFALTYLFISHDLRVVKHICDRVGVMYLGHLVEFAPKDQIFEHPLHPYTKALLSAVPEADPDATRNRIILEGDVPNPANPPKGCVFHTRCPVAKEVCRTELPKFKPMDRNGHLIACHLAQG